MCLTNFFDTYGSMISTLALVATLIVLIIYTVATWLLRKESVKQTELSLRPYVILTLATGGGRLNFENIGHGHALDVSIDVLHMSVFIVRHNPRRLVRKGQRVGAGFVLVGRDAAADEMVNASPSNMGYPFFEGLTGIRDYPLTVRYKNIEGTSYYTQLEVRVHERRVIIKKSGKDKKPRS